jgi:hypothetical protein
MIVTLTVDTTKKPDKPPGKPPGGGPPGQSNNYTVNLASGSVGLAIAHVVSTSGGIPPVKVMAIMVGKYLTVPATSESEWIVHGYGGKYTYIGAEGAIG